MPDSSLKRIYEFGQSVWLDYIRREMLANGTLAKLIDEDGVAGVTSNPAIFNDAIARHGDYDAAITELAASGADVSEIYETIVVEDIRRAADLLRPVHDATGGGDGFVSLEVPPGLAHDTDGTIAEARRLVRLLDRRNVMIKVPGTSEGLPAIRRLIADGINVNVTLLFGLQRHLEVLNAFIGGLEDRKDAARDLADVVSVASFFVSRIDTLVDKRLDSLAQGSELRGATAIACAKLAYRNLMEASASQRWRRLAAHGARTQRLLWASTGTKDSAYSDVKYVEALIGPETVVTLPPTTLDAFRDHGRPEARLTTDLDRTGAIPGRLEKLGIDLDAVANELEADGIRQFAKSFEALQDALNRKGRAA